ncbi:MAG: glycine--tRNA ligase subunit beta [Pseudomonadota bacterium]|nr:glycine--tRNA ligase subunit beta [Pseudomonadota bacterium]
MQARARNDLAKLFAEAMAKAGLSHSAIDVWSTPRRLALIARGLPTKTVSVRNTMKGPRLSAPPQALEGFLRKTGLSQDQLEERDGVWFAVIDEPGRPAVAVVGDAVAGIIRDFPWPKSMRWGEASACMSALRWVRPLHSIVAILGEEIVPVAIDGVACGATTLGHRFHHPGPITIGGASDYAGKLRACHVIVDHQERETIVRDGTKAAALAAGYSLVEDEGLVVENAGLTEWPVPLLGSFDPDFLNVPPEVIQLTARINQKYFVMRGDEGALAPAFLCTANIAANDGGAAIVEGNRRVLAARLSDARFFWEQDVKIPLEEQAQRLSGIVFHDKLGSIADKVERIARMARWLVEEGIVKSADPAQADRAARLAKADLVTGMVGEFPELQGVIGGYLAAAQGEPREVSDAIRDHYKPVGQGDEVPTAPVTVAVSLADKLDTLFSFFDAGMLPTGSKDPFALRRAAIAYLRTVEATGLRLLVSEAARYWNEGPGVGPGLVLEEFLHDRLGVMMRDEGVRYDFVQAATHLASRVDGDLWRVRRRATALQSFIETPEGTDLHAGYKRAANILKKEAPLNALLHPDANHRAAEVPGEESALADALDQAQLRAAAAAEAEDFAGAMAALASLRAPIDAFFENVTVNDPDRAIRARRLELLTRFRDAVHQVADFSKIEG